MQINEISNFIDANKIIVIKAMDKIDSQADVLWLISDAHTGTIHTVFIFGCLKAKHFL